MDEVAVLAIVMVFGIPMLAILGWILLSALKILKGESKRGGREMDADEARVMQEIHQGLAKLESRVESLETLLLERAKMEKWEQLERE
jgi:phage shock protein B